jgi:hypothetical protein
MINELKTSNRDLAQEILVRKQFFSEFHQLMNKQLQETQRVYSLNSTIHDYANANGNDMTSRIKELAETARRAWSS